MRFSCPILFSNSAQCFRHGSTPHSLDGVFMGSDVWVKRVGDEASRKGPRKSFCLCVSIHFDCCAPNEEKSIDPPEVAPPAIGLRAKTLSPLTTCTRLQETWCRGSMAVHFFGQKLTPIRETFCADCSLKTPGVNNLIWRTASKYAALFLSQGAMLWIMLGASNPPVCCHYFSLASFFRHRCPQVKPEVQVWSPAHR